MPSATGSACPCWCWCRCGLVLIYTGERDTRGGTFASAPMAWIQICYDEHYPGTIGLFHVHRPLAWLDQRVTGTEVRMWSNDFHGNRDNYGREAFN